MRGICVYVLNMFSNTIQGRQLMNTMNWISYNKQDLGWICGPKNIS